MMPYFNLQPTFFGFRPEHQVQLHNQIFDLIWAGAGRWSFHEIYTMPLRIRKLWISKVNMINNQSTDAANNLGTTSADNFRRSPN